MKISKDSLERLKQELKRLETEERKKISERLKKAISFGDLSENAEYAIAKEEQAELERKILELKVKISKAEVVEERDFSKITLGSKVKIELEDGKILTFEIVDSDEVNPSEGKISLESPLGKALKDKSKGDQILLPSGKRGKIKDLL